MEPLIKAGLEDLDDVLAFYEDVTDHIQFEDFHPGWQRGLYPRRIYLEEAIAKGRLYLGKDQGQIVGGVVLDHEAPPGYEKAKWPQDIPHHKIYYIHTFAVSPSAQGKGYGKKMIQAIKDLAQARGMAALRLDVLRDYDRAKGLYDASGLSFVDQVELYYPDVAWKTFSLYEYLFDT